MTVDRAPVSAARWYVPGKAVPQGSLRAFMAGGMPRVRYSNREPLAYWRDTVRDACPILEPEPGAWGVELVFLSTRPRGHMGASGILPRYLDSAPISRPDLDKLARAVIDALTMRVWRDDAQVTELYARKAYADAPGVYVAVYRP